MEKTRNACWGLAGMSVKRNCLEELDIDGRIILKVILKTRITYVDSSGSRR